ncbi:MAG: MFS transporter [Nitrospinota bacterium]|nr:MFS transporter [Nitrospinota bacterium]
MQSDNSVNLNTKSSLHRKKLSFLVIAHIANDSCFGFLSPVIPILKETLNIPLSLVGFLGPTLAATGALGQPIFGLLADRFQKNWLLALGPILGGLVAFATMVDSIPLLFLLLFIAGLGSACFHPIASVRAVQFSGKRRGLGVSIYIAGGRLGVSLGAAMVTFVVTRFGVAGLPYTCLFVFFIGFLLLFLNLDTGEEFEEKTSKKNPIDLKSVGIVFRSLARLWFVNYFRTVVTMSITFYLSIYLIEKGNSFADGGFSISVFLLAAAIGGIFGGYISDLFGRRMIIIFSLLIGTPCLGISLYFDDLYIRLFFLIMAGAAFYSQMGVSVTYAQELIPEHAALASSFMLGVVWFCSSMTMPLIGVFADYFGILTVMPFTCMMFGFFGFLLSVRLPKTKDF